MISDANGSTDVGDVSWICPTAQAHTVTFVSGTPGHSRQATTVGKTTAAHKMVLYAAKSMATLAVEFIRDEALLAKARAEHKKRVGPNGYRCPIPAGVKPARHERVFRKRVTRVPQSAEIAKGACFGRRLSCPCAKEHGKAGNLCLSFAGKEPVKGNAKIIDIAHKHGNDTPESFLAPSPDFTVLRRARQSTATMTKLYPSFRKTDLAGEQ